MHFGPEQILDPRRPPCEKLDGPGFEPRLIVISRESQIIRRQSGCDRLRLPGREPGLANTLKLEQRARHARHRIAQEEEYGLLSRDGSLVLHRDLERGLATGAQLAG